MPQVKLALCTEETNCKCPNFQGHKVRSSANMSQCLLDNSLVTQGPLHIIAGLRLTCTGGKSLGLLCRQERVKTNSKTLEEV